MDNVLIFERTKEEHDTRLESVLRRGEAAGVSLNRTKCKFRKAKSSFWVILYVRMGFNKILIK